MSPTFTVSAALGYCSSEGRRTGEIGIWHSILSHTCNILRLRFGHEIHDKLHALSGALICLLYVHPDRKAFRDVVRASRT